MNLKPLCAINPSRLDCSTCAKIVGVIVLLALVGLHVAAYVSLV